MNKQEHEEYRALFEALRWSLHYAKKQIVSSEAESDMLKLCMIKADDTMEVTEKRLKEKDEMDLMTCPTCGEETIGDK